MKKATQFLLLTFLTLLLSCQADDESILIDDSSSTEVISSKSRVRPQIIKNGKEEIGMTELEEEIKKYLEQEKVVDQYGNAIESVEPFLNVLFGQQNCTVATGDVEHSCGTASWYDTILYNDEQWSGIPDQYRYAGCAYDGPTPIHLLEFDLEIRENYLCSIPWQLDQNTGGGQNETFTYSMPMIEYVNFEMIIFYTRDENSTTDGALYSRCGEWRKIGRLTLGPLVFEVVYPWEFIRLYDCMS